jgi:hypothetical protein
LIGGQKNVHKSILSTSHYLSVERYVSRQHYEIGYTHCNNEWSNEVFSPSVFQCHIRFTKSIGVSDSLSFRRGLGRGSCSNRSNQNRQLMDGQWVALSLDARCAFHISTSLGSCNLRPDVQHEADCYTAVYPMQSRDQVSTIQALQRKPHRYLGTVVSSATHAVLSSAPVRSHIMQYGSTMSHYFSSKSLHQQAHECIWNTCSSNRQSHTCPLPRTTQSVCSSRRALLFPDVPNRSSLTILKYHFSQLTNYTLFSVSELQSQFFWIAHNIRASFLAISNFKIVSTL